MTYSQIKDGQYLESTDGEIFSVRVYSDGWTKITSFNARFDFASRGEAFEYAQRLGLIIKHKYNN